MRKRYKNQNQPLYQKIIEVILIFFFFVFLARFLKDFKYLKDAESDPQKFSEKITYLKRTRGKTYTRILLKSLKRDALVVDDVAAAEGVAAEDVAADEDVTYELTDGTTIEVGYTSVTITPKSGDPITKTIDPVEEKVIIRSYFKNGIELELELELGETAEIKNGTLIIKNASGESVTYELSESPTLNIEKEPLESSVTDEETNSLTFVNTRDGGRQFSEPFDPRRSDSFKYDDDVSEVGKLLVNAS